MAHAVVDEAIRNVVAVGADPAQVALLDNFSWGDPRRPSTLGDLVVAVRGCCDASVAHAAPFVSGKDSLNNEYVGADGLRHSVPPTLVITAVAHVPDANAVITPDLDRPDDALVLVGRTGAEFGGSHLHLINGATGGAVPAPDADAPARYRALHAALRSGRIRACHDVSEGGLAVALAEMAIGGGLGITVDDAALAALAPDVTTALFAESTGRLVCEVAADDVDWLAAQLAEPVTVVATVTAHRSFRMAGRSVALDELRAAFSGTGVA